jgi:tetratricopeptide (TPR) repeat protein
MDNENFDYAIRLYELIKGVNDRIFTVLKGLGDAYFALGKKEAALENYKRALELRPNDDYIQKRIRNLTGKV